MKERGREARKAAIKRLKCITHMQTDFAKLQIDSMEYLH